MNTSHNNLRYKENSIASKAGESKAEGRPVTAILGAMRAKAKGLNQLKLVGTERGTHFNFSEDKGSLRRVTQHD